MRTLTPVVKQILIGCIVLFAGTYLMEARNIDLRQWLSVFYPRSPLFKPWQLVTHMFMHGNLGHIVFNMFALVSIGSVIERFMGGKKFLQLYFISGFGAILVHFISQAVELYNITGMWFPSLSDMGMTVVDERVRAVGPMSQTQYDEIFQLVFGPVLGASGAIYGVVVAFAYLFPNSELMIMFIPYPIKAKYLVPAFIVLDVILGISSIQGDSIAHFAHFGGALFGFALVFYWRKFDKRNFY